jgi:hypothetical protein
VLRLCSNGCALAQTTPCYIAIPAGVVGQQGTGAPSRNVSPPRCEPAKSVLVGVQGGRLFDELAALTVPTLLLFLESADRFSLWLSLHHDSCWDGPSQPGVSPRVPS